jgi:hypothetical protein
MARKKSNVSPTETWDKESKVDEYDGRANTNAGDKGKEPGGRWSTAYYETPGAVISKYEIRKP